MVNKDSLKQTEIGSMYEARALGYSIYTQAENLEELKSAIRDAVECHFEDVERPHIIRLHIVKDKVLAGKGRSHKGTL